MMLIMRMYCFYLSNNAAKMITRIRYFLLVIDTGPISGIPSNATLFSDHTMGIIFGLDDAIANTFFSFTN